MPRLVSSCLAGPGDFGRRQLAIDPQGVQKDDAQAVKWYRKAAEQGFAKGQYNLGLMYSHGFGVQQDDAQATKWFRKAARQGNTEARSELRKRGLRWD